MLDLYHCGTVSNMVETIDNIRQAGCEVVYQESTDTWLDPAVVARFCAAQSLVAVHLTSKNAGPYGQAFTELEKELSL